MKLPSDPRIIDGPRLVQRLVDLHRDISRQVNGLSEGRIAARYGATVAAPTTGLHGKGDIVWNSAPAEVGSAPNTYVTLGWVCVDGGEPGTWAPMNVPTATFGGGGGGGVSDGDKGDIVVSGSGSVWDIDPGVLTPFGRSLVGATSLASNAVLLGNATGVPQTVAMTTGQFLVGQAAGAPLAKSISGDISVSASGTAAIVANAVTTTAISDSNVTEQKLASDAVTSIKILNAAVTYPKIQSVTAASRLLGRGSSGSGQVEELSVGTGLQMTGTTLSATAGSDKVNRSGDTMTGPLVISSDDSIDSVFFSLTPTDYTSAPSTEFRMRSWRYSGITAGAQVWELSALGAISTAVAELHIRGDPVWLKGQVQADNFSALDSMRPLAVAPSTATASGVINEIRVDDDYMYVYTSAGWKTLTLRTFKT